MQTLTRQTLGIYWRHSKRYPLPIILIVFGLVLAIITDLAQPFFYRGLVNYISTGDRSSIEYPLRMVAYIIAMAVLYNVAWRSVVAATNVFQGKVKRDLYRTCYDYLLQHSSSFFSNNFVGGLVAKIGRFDRSFESIADELIFGAGRTAFLLLMVFGVLLYHIPLAGIIFVVWTTLYLIIAYYLNKFRLKYDLATAEQDTKATGHVADTMTNALTVKQFASEEVEKESFAEITQEQYIRRRKTWDISNYIEVVQGVMMVLLEVVILYAAVILWQQNEVTVGDFILLQSYMLSTFYNLWNVGRNMRRLYQSIADSNEMTELLLMPHEIADAQDAVPIQITKGQVSFKNMKFGYKDNKAIYRNFNLDIASGERVAFVGPSGGGKSTIVKLLFRNYDLQGGTIQIDGQDISKVTQSSLREQVSLVPQDPILFHRSLLENIRYAKPDATLREVIAAAKAAHCHEFIDKLPAKYETFVGERGVKLSGGERQRVAIARAILKNSPILVLDEATSSLDSESEKLIQDALKNLMEGKTTIVIAHRLSTIMAMDRIVVIEGGKIVEQGSHSELLKVGDGKYQKLWHIQAGGFI